MTVDTAESLVLTPDLADPVTASEGQTYTHEGKRFFRLHNVLAEPAVFSLMPENSGKDFTARQVEVAQPVTAAGPKVHSTQGADLVVEPTFVMASRGDEKGQRFDVRADGTANALTGNGGGRGGTGLGALASPVEGYAVRRMTPRECERLQGLPDDWTLVPYRKGLAKDGPRYRAIGNAMPVPVMAHIARAIHAQVQLEEASHG